jgi:hypothetical protein
MRSQPSRDFVLIADHPDHGAVLYLRSAGVCAGHKLPRAIAETVARSGLAGDTIALVANRAPEGRHDVPIAIQFDNGCPVEVWESRKSWPELLADLDAYAVGAEIEHQRQVEIDTRTRHVRGGRRRA